MKISEILTKLGGDGEFSTDKNRCRKWGHCYGKAYDHIFKSFDRKAKLDIVEVGTEWGASLLAWRMFFPNANITGIDIVDMVKDKLPDVEYIISDVKDFKPEKEFDIVIDDGSHKLSDVLHTVWHLRLKVGGVMIIEDCQAPDHWYEKIRKNTTYSIETIDLRHIYKQHDDFLIVLRNYGYHI